MISFIYKSWSLECGRLRNSLLNGGAILIDLGSFETRRIFEFWLARGQAATRDLGGAIRESIKDIAFAAMTCWSIRDSKELLSLHLSTKQLTLRHFEFAAFCFEIRGYENWRGGRQVQWVGEGSLCKALGSLRLVTWILREWCIGMLRNAYDIIWSFSFCVKVWHWSWLRSIIHKGLCLDQMIVGEYCTKTRDSNIFDRLMDSNDIWGYLIHAWWPRYSYLFPRRFKSLISKERGLFSSGQLEETQQARMFKVTAICSNHEKKVL